ncbi:hypothetical protein COEREDRAFT_88602 [Coemansia reversa NRRL 1564]|uniref:Barwin-like endoglucanase n=1 Tax=Coemansia reversa (strain ATCC 12441 / NRRL 1564) TaxID=763665 RepID=A0A2G5B6K1_COERN|nr:hypothetical protein COEREDRAFT_88602 [Coemansia reversa NRRL 1564]|eukprot:PIA14631.1 hypothetical protein COEREDRAFT_88602 [Coemansia reversa NRRL 1564]
MRSICTAFVVMCVVLIGAQSATVSKVQVASSMLAEESDSAGHFNGDANIDNLIRNQCNVAITESSYYVGLDEEEFVDVATNKTKCSTCISIVNPANGNKTIIAKVVGISQGGTQKDIFLNQAALTKLAGKNIDYVYDITWSYVECAKA